MLALVRLRLSTRILFFDCIKELADYIGLVVVQDKLGALGRLNLFNVSHVNAAFVALLVSYLQAKLVSLRFISCELELQWKG